MRRTSSGLVCRESDEYTSLPWVRQEILEYVGDFFLFVPFIDRRVVFVKTREEQLNGSIRGRFLLCGSLHFGGYVFGHPYIQVATGYSEKYR
jgi:hypothetical protein